MRTEPKSLDEIFADMRETLGQDRDGVDHFERQKRSEELTRIRGVAESLGRGHYGADLQALTNRYCPAPEHASAEELDSFARQLRSERSRVAAPSVHVLRR